MMKYLYSLVFLMLMGFSIQADEIITTYSELPPTTHTVVTQYHYHNGRPCSINHRGPYVSNYYYRNRVHATPGYYSNKYYYPSDSYHRREVVTQTVVEDQMVL